MERAGSQVDQNIEDDLPTTVPEEGVVRSISLRNSFAGATVGSTHVDSSSDRERVNTTQFDLTAGDTRLRSHDGRRLVLFPRGARNEAILSGSDSESLGGKGFARWGFGRRFSSCGRGARTTNSSGSQDRTTLFGHQSCFAKPRWRGFEGHGGQVGISSDKPGVGNLLAAHAVPQKNEEPSPSRSWRNGSRGLSPGDGCGGIGPDKQMNTCNLMIWPSLPREQFLLFTHLNEVFRVGF